MTTVYVKGQTSSRDEEDSPLFFHEWLKRCRQERDLTQVQLAKRASCTVFTIRKIEKGERRPSRQLAGLLSQSLEIPSDYQTIFIKVARGELGAQRLPSLAHMTSGDPHTEVMSGSIPGNMPLSLTPFIGREPELNALGELLQNPLCSLVTIVGFGGTGKTRLAIEAAQHAGELFPDGIWFVPLASLNSRVQIVPAIADALDFKFQGPTNPQAQLIRYLRAKKALLVLDNTEHLLAGVEVFTELLKDCQQVKILVTSRERLNLMSEWVFDIQGLPIPPNDQVDQFEAYSSVALFLQSARRACAGFEIRMDDRRWIRQICWIMGGMPLGIELSAAWVEILSCEEIAREIEQNLGFLSVSMRDLPERQRSMRATLDHSWKLLTPDEKLILSRLSVFRGGFSREAAQAICEVNLRVLSSLKDKSLLYRNDQAYYYLHEIIRQYAGLKLAEQPAENERVKDQHAFYYVQCLSVWEKALKSSRQVETFNQMAQNIDNLSLGWQHMVKSCRPRIEQSDIFCADLIHSALFSLSLFYEMRCRSLEAIPLFKESIEYLQSVRDEFEQTEDRSSFFSVLGHITAYLGLHHVYLHQYGKAVEHLEDAIQLLEEGQSRKERAQAQVILAAVKSIHGQLRESAAMLEQCREVFREEGDDWWYSLSGINLALYYTSLGKLEESEALYQEGLRSVEPGDLRLSLSLRTGYACLFYLKNDFVKAEQWMQENLQLSYQLGNDRRTASNLLNLGRVALATHQIELAIEYIQKSIHLLGGYGELFDLTMLHIYLGKCFAARPDRPAAIQQFRQAIKIGQAFDLFYLVYWGLANIARTYFDEGQTGQALRISLALRHCPTDFQIIQDDMSRLLADLQTASPAGESVALNQAEGVLPGDQARENVLAIALEYGHE